MPSFNKFMTTSSSSSSGGGGKEGSGVGAGKATTVIATPGGGPDRPQEISYTDTKVIGNGSFGVVYQARLIASSSAATSGTVGSGGIGGGSSSSLSQQQQAGTASSSSSLSSSASTLTAASSGSSQQVSEMVAIKRVLQDKRFKNRELQIMRRLDHCNIVKLKYYFYTSGEKVSDRSVPSLAPCCTIHSKCLCCHHVCFSPPSCHPFPLLHTQGSRDSHLIALFSLIHPLINLTEGRSVPEPGTGVHSGDGVPSRSSLQ